MNRKRKQSSTQSVTLDKYFTKAGPSSLDKKPKLSSTKNPIKLPKKSSKARTDVIVIESDDDSASVNASHIVIESSSDIEILDGPPPTQKTRVTSKAPQRLSQGNSRAVLATQSPPRQESVASVNSAQYAHSTTLLVSSQASLAGKTSFCVDEPPLTEETLIASPSVHQQCHGAYTSTTGDLVGSETQPIDGHEETETQQVLLEGIDTWGMGDDEMDVVNADLEPESQFNVDIDLTLDEGTPSSGRGISCPVCNLTFDGLLAPVSLTFLHQRPI